MKSRITIIKNKLDLLKSLDKDFSIFGSDKHKYISVKADISEIERFENKYSCLLPAEYREFLIEIGSGAGPSYGILSLEKIEKYISSAMACYNQVVDPAAEFEIDNEAVQAYFQRDSCSFENYIYDGFTMENLSGIIPICYKGCTYYACIITNGIQSGAIWDMDEGVPAYLTPAAMTSNIGFYDWYEQWLDLSLRPGVIVNNPSMPPSSPQNVQALNYHGKKFTMIPEHVFECANLAEINLSYNYLTNVTPKILKLQKIEKLNLNDNKLGQIPFVISGLKNLKVLDLGKNEIEYWGKSISLFNKIGYLIRKQNTTLGFEKLEFLDISSNKLKQIPNEIRRFKKLKRLWISYNCIESVSECIGELKELEDLCICGNKLEKLPRSIGNIESLIKLDLYSNQLKEIPESIGNLKNLKELILYSNKLEAVPASIGNLKSLEVLDLSSNMIKKLPDEIGDLNNLKVLKLSGNNISELPKSMLEMKSLRVLYIGKNLYDSMDIRKVFPNTRVLPMRW